MLCINLENLLLSEILCPLVNISLIPACPASENLHSTLLLFVVV
jgi:hypothetical protein